jgi:signal transduction histidine kinase
MKRGERKPGVHAKVVAAVCVVAAMTLVAGAVSRVFYARIESLLVSVADHQATAVAQALRLAEASNRFAAGAGEIDTARTQLQRQNAAVALSQHAFALHELIAGLRLHTTIATMQIDAVSGLVDSIEDNLDSLNRLAERRIALETQARRNAATTSRLQAGFDGLMERLEDQAGDIVGRLTLEAAIGRVLLCLAEVGQVDRAALLPGVRAAYNTSRAWLGSAASVLPASTPLRDDLTGLLGRLDALAAAREGIFAQREAALSLRGDVDPLVVQERELVTRLGLAVARLVGTAETEAERTRADIAAQTDEGRRWLLAVAVVTFLGPMTIVWLAVNRTIALPLTRLAEATRRIAAGDLQAAVPPGNTREFAAIGEALAVFRDNTAALAERTRDLQRSEDAQRAAREEAERALHELRETQEQLVQREKMAALGSLIAGVAHEINTPLGITVTSASMLSDEVRTIVRVVDTGKLTRSHLAAFLARAGEAAALIESNMDRAAGLVQAFKQVAADQSSEQRRIFNLKETIEQTVLSTKPAWQRAGHVVRVEAPAGIVLDSFPGALSQVLTVLLMNSLDHAFGESGKGTISIVASAAGAGDTAAGEGDVRIDYRDDGCGIPPDIQRKVFEPFFTTRRSQGNTGLGLHLAFNVVQQQLNGRIDLAVGDDEPGSHFVLRIPPIVSCDVGSEVGGELAGV